MTASTSSTATNFSVTAPLSLVLLSTRPQPCIIVNDSWTTICAAARAAASRVKTKVVYIKRPGQLCVSKVLFEAHKLLDLVHLSPVTPGLPGSARPAHDTLCVDTSKFPAIDVLHAAMLFYHLPCLAQTQFCAHQEADSPRLQHKHHIWPRLSGTSTYEELPHNRWCETQHG